MRLTNLGQAAIVVGMPLVASGSNGVRIGGGETVPVFALAGNNATYQQSVEAVATGTIERADWQLICGEKYLSPGTMYYTGALGKIGKATSSIEVGTADTKTRLTVRVRPATSSLSASGTGTVGPQGPAGPAGADGVDGTGYLDGGEPDSVYGGIDNIDGGVS